MRMYYSLLIEMLIKCALYEFIQHNFFNITSNYSDYLEYMVHEFSFCFSENKIFVSVGEKTLLMPILSHLTYYSV